MANASVDTDVLIVGAGPVGLLLANECARRGLRWQLIEQNAAQSIHSKALAIFPRTLEIFEMAGVVAPFLERANRVTAVSVVTHGRTLAHMTFIPEESPYGFIAMVPQNVTEAILVGELRARGGDVQYETKLLSADQRDGYVDVVVDRNGKRETLVAAFVVGCDGAHSAVRHALGVQLVGGEYRDSFMLADIATNDALPVDELQLCPSEAGPLAIFPMSAERRRIVATIEDQQGDAPSLELVRKLLAERAPGGIEARALYWSSYFRIHHRHAEEMRNGRIFIAGDAAHVHSPFGGQGMNTGLHDVWNLVWKLEFVIRGFSGDELLATYAAERLPIIKDVIETTDTLTKVMGTSNKLAQVLRDTFIPMISRVAPFHHAFVNRLSELGIAYRGSPIIEGPGTRYFDDWMRGGNGISSRFQLLVDGTLENTAEEMFQVFRDILQIRCLGHRGIILVRPDGYLAYEAAQSDTSALQSARAVLERQAGQAGTAQR